jgi:hypothetical protein
LTETHVPNNRRTTVRVPNESTARPKRVLSISDNYSVASRAPDPRRYLGTLTQQNLLPQSQETQQESPQTLPHLPELDRIATQRAERLPPFRSFLDTLAMRERQQLTRRPEHNNNRVVCVPVEMASYGHTNTCHICSIIRSPLRISLDWIHPTCTR